MFALPLGAALATGIVLPIGVVWIAALGGATYAFGRPDTAGWQRGLAAMAIVALAAGLATHRLPGFDNPRVISAVRLTPDALPYSLHLNFDKTALGLFLIGFCHARIATRADAARMLRRAAPAALGTIGLILILSLALGYVRFDPKWPRDTWLWLVANLCFTCLAEEAIFRGFLQNHLARAWRGAAGGEWLALGIAAAAFGLAHFAGGPTYIALATVAGVGYGLAYRRTRCIEAGILLHFTLNAVHFLGFTYPALEKNI
jgi:membrane protease YdiL (CAAX protease family)